LSITLLGLAVEPEPASTESLTAYDLFLLARKERFEYSFGGLEASERYLKAALRVDPRYTLAKTELATNYLYQQATGLMVPEDAYAMADALTLQVLEDEPNDVNARAIQYFLSALPGDVETSPDAAFSAIDALKDLVAEHPDEYEVRSLLTALLSKLRRFDEALLLQLDALYRDPLNARILFEVGSLYMSLDDFAEARRALNRSLELERRSRTRTPSLPHCHADRRRCRVHPANARGHA
jgi:predicted Zn-dependent protease